MEPELDFRFPKVRVLCLLLSLCVVAGSKHTKSRHLFWVLYAHKTISVDFRDELGGLCLSALKHACSSSTDKQAPGLRTG